MEHDPVNTFGKRALETLIAVNANDKRIRDDMAETVAEQIVAGQTPWNFGPVQRDTKKGERGRR
jgi:hypothetical protein